MAEDESFNEKIRKLREVTGAGMMDCKRALSATDGDLDKALAYLREKGLADGKKRVSRTASEGLIDAALTADGKRGAIVELNCETDFVAKTDEFNKLINDLARKAADGELREPIDAEEGIAALRGKLGENICLKRLDRFETNETGHLGFYVHSSGRKKGSFIEFSCCSDSVARHEATEALSREIGMQIVAMSPRWVRREDVPVEAVEKERGIFTKQLLKEGKPAAAIPDIVEGKLKKLFFQAYCLNEQMSMRDNKTPLQAVISDAAKKAGGAITVKRFVRYQLGEE